MKNLTVTPLTRKLIIYLLKFIISFCILYYGTLAIIGLSAPGGYYNKFIADHLNFVDWLRYSLLVSAKFILSLFGYTIKFMDKYVIRMENGSGIRMVYSCVGYGVMSFWGAFIFANTGSWKKKVKWICGGWLLIWGINVARVCLIILAVNKNWSMPLGFDHHTWFNIAAYGCIFVLIYFYDLSQKKKGILDARREI